MKAYWWCRSGCDGVPPGLGMNLDCTPIPAVSLHYAEPPHRASSVLTRPNTLLATESGLSILHVQETLKSMD